MMTLAHATEMDVEYAAAVADGAMQSMAKHLVPATPDNFTVWFSDARLTRRTTGQEISRLTVSIGVAQFKLAESAETMIERCDRALYQAKAAGRNQTVTEQNIQG